MEIRLGIMLILGFALPLRAGADLLPIEKQTGILRVSSEFEKGVRETGTGIYFTYPGNPDRAFLFTCAHLSTGSGVRIGDIPLEQLMKSRTTDAFHDVDVIEIDPAKLPAKPFAHYEPNLKEFAHRELDSLPSGDDGVPFGFLVADPAALRRWKKSEATLKAEPRESDFVLVPPWSAKSMAEKPTDQKKLTGGGAWASYSQNSPRESYVGGTIWKPARIAPGMSCSPLIGKSGKQFPVQGMGVEFKNHMTGSFFASDTLMLRTLYSHLKKEKPEIAADWKSQNGLLYLALGEHRAEIVPAKPAGNAVGLPSGNGVSTPPGNGVSTPPGNRSAETWACSPYRKSENPWQKIGSAPAILWDDKPVMAFGIKFPGNQEMSLVYPDRHGIELRLQATKLAEKATELPLGTSLLSYLDDRVDHPLIPYELQSAYWRDGLLKDGPRIQRMSDRIKISFYGPKPENELVTFSLNEKGAVIDPPAEDPGVFQPLVEVPGPSGKYYLVDLTQLFFRQASIPGTIDFWRQHRVLVKEALREKPGLPVTDDHRKDLLDTLTHGLEVDRSPGLSYRQKCSTQEFSFHTPFATPLLVREIGCQDNTELNNLPPEWLHVLPEVIEELRREPATSR